MVKCGIIAKNSPTFQWDGETTVGSNWDGETVVGSESNLDLKFCKDSLKLRDPQLNLSPEFLNEMRVINVYVYNGDYNGNGNGNGNDKGKGIAIDLDLNLDYQENFQNRVEDTDLDEVDSIFQENITRALNESRITYQYNLINGESSRTGGNIVEMWGGSNPLRVRSTNPECDKPTPV